jgi:hypothetical protein
MSYMEIIWDLEEDPDGNVRHILDGHDVTLGEVEEVLRGPNNETIVSQSSGQQGTFGWTLTGKYILVIWEEVSEDPRIAYPITAYPVPPPKGKRHGKRSNR